jgi:predicted DCC family thiol-disulfide oxidoreductase YuxK
VPPPGQPIVLYDADCGFCRWSLAKLLAWDRERRLRPAALQSPEATELLGDLDEERRMASWHLVEPGGRRTSGGIAVVPLLRLLPGGRLPAGLLARFPGLVDRGYCWVADHRGALGRRIPRSAARRADTRIAERGG